MSLQNTHKIFVFSLFPLDKRMKTGGQARLQALLIGLRSIHPNIHHVCLYGQHDTSRTRTILGGSILETWIPINSANNKTLLVEKFKKFSLDTLAAHKLEQNEHIIEFLKKISFKKSIMIANHFWFGALINDLNWKQTFLFSHNFESDFISPQEYGEAFVEFYLQREIKLINNFNKIIVCSETDRRKYQLCLKAQNIDILVCGNGSFIEPLAINFSKRISHKCLYIGSHWPSNVEGIERIIRHNPSFLKNYEINLVGSIEKAFPKIKKQGLIFHGILSEKELLEIASKCSFAVNPIFSGGGSNVKNADYLALGLPILTTKFGVRGFEKYKKFIEIEEIQSWRDIRKNQVPISIRRKMSWNNSLKTFMETLSI